MWSVSILLIIISFATSASQDKLLFADANCTIIYSLKHSANSDFSQDIALLEREITKQNVALIDLNNWQKLPPHIQLNGRQRNQIRTTFDLPKDTNQAIVFNIKGQLVSRRTGSVALVNALLDCKS